MDYRSGTQFRLRLFTVHYVVLPVICGWFGSGSVPTCRWGFVLAHFLCLLVAVLRVVLLLYVLSLRVPIARWRGSAWRRTLRFARVRTVMLHRRRTAAQRHAWTPAPVCVITAAFLVSLCSHLQYLTCAYYTISYGSISFNATRLPYFIATATLALLFSIHPCLPAACLFSLPHIPRYVV
jgi:hypothetical protein